MSRQGRLGGTSGGRRPSGATLTARVAAITARAVAALTAFVVVGPTITAVIAACAFAIVAVFVAIRLPTVMVVADDELISV